MHEEGLGHIEFWTQLRQYLGDHKIQIRLSGSPKSSSSDVFLTRSYFRLRPSHLLKDNQLGVFVQFDGPGAMARYELVAQQHRQKVNERLSPLGALDWQPGKISLSRSTTPSRPETWEERNAWMVNAIETMRALFNEIFPPAPPLKLEFHDGKVVNSDTAEEYDVMAVAARLPWQAQKTGNSSWEDYPPYMPPHEYVVFGKCNYADWDVLYFACRKHPARYLAYFRGYQSPMWYWEPGNGYRYWHTAPHGVSMLNRCTLDSVEPPRRVDEGAKPIKPKDWGAPPWLPQGSGWRGYLKKHPDLARELGVPLDQ
jgi:hypothetical protein